MEPSKWATCAQMWFFPQQRLQRCGVLILLPLVLCTRISGDLPAEMCRGAGAKVPGCRGRMPGCPTGCLPGAWLAAAAAAWLLHGCLTAAAALAATVAAACVCIHAPLLLPALSAVGDQKEPPEQIQHGTQAIKECV